jgi:hypothetical protein
MKGIALAGIVAVLLSLSNCRKNNDYDQPVATLEMINEYNEQRRHNNDTMYALLQGIETDRNNVNRPLPEAYINCFGQTKEDIIHTLGDNYVIDYGGDFTRKETIIYNGITIGLLTGNNASRVDYLFIHKDNVTYVGNIRVGCTIEDMINQLGKPAMVDYVTKQCIYFSPNIRIAFSINLKGMIKEIMVSDYTESYNLRLEMHD